MLESGYTSRQAARISGVPFFTVDYWDRSKFIRPSIAASAGRGRGRGRLYSYSDILRLAIARELRERQVSIQTLRHVVQRLGQLARDLAGARYVYVGRRVELSADFGGLVAILERPGRRFGFLLDLADIQQRVAYRAARALEPRRAPAGAKLARD